jgi:hypothetical protein
MAEARLCPQCGAELPVDAPAGLCPRCLLQQGIRKDSGTPSSLANDPTLVPRTTDPIGRAPMSATSAITSYRKKSPVAGWAWSTRRGRTPSNASLR